ncbi:hypothetical protein HYPSUDRAFT_55552 [Hypholoma sublateritium FD-334 SS-4]|uniref:Uncharacterized protein n=1 Tax=Hypholoma sublateritium (strain FD-334 SS-4) TaxID=945553 RepID=A0A0D2NR94_HYPSF|nr:hypothetical protein HYPSUDRAFT_55552 [Hypholoma sublateritium FD-334 SS-4]
MDRRAPPPQGAPPSYAFVARMYRRSLRPVVLACSVLAGLWTLFSGIGFFRNASFWSDHNESKLHISSIILGALYMGVLVIELVGLHAAASQKVAPARAYAWLSALAVLIIAATGLIRVVLHFTEKSAIINTCATVTQDEDVFFPGFFGPVNAGRLDPLDAQQWCQNQWDRDSWSDIVAFLIITTLATFIAAIAFAFLRQLLDPTSPANQSRAPSSGVPAHYAPPYPSYNPHPNNPSYPGYNNPSAPPYAPPAGPPPGRFGAPEEEGKPPGYVRGFEDPFADGDKKDGKDGEGGKGGYGWAWGGGFCGVVVFLCAAIEERRQRALQIGGQRKLFPSNIYIQRPNDNVSILLRVGRAIAQCKY